MAGTRRMWRARPVLTTVALGLRALSSLAMPVLAGGFPLALGLRHDRRGQHARIAGLSALGLCDRAPPVSA